MNTNPFDLTTSSKSTSGESGCCPPGSCDTKAPMNSTQDISADTVREKVREGYSAIASAGSWSAAQAVASNPHASNPLAPNPPGSVAPATEPAGACGPTAGGGCCGPASFTPDQLSAALGYSFTETHTLPEANLGLSCGNPTAIATLKTGEVVLDLGSGAGFDCFVAGPKVGPTGRVIGVDMTPAMVTKARTHNAMYQQRTGLKNVEFRLGEIEHLPVEDHSVDVVISNCVLNLSPDKPQVWREIARVLKPGGRVAVSDLALVQPLPEAVREDIEALVGCVAGAVLISEVRAAAARAGLRNLVLTPKPQYIDAMTQWEDPLYQRILSQLPAGAKASDYITSLDIVGVAG